MLSNPLPPEQRPTGYLWCQLAWCSAIGVAVVVPTLLSLFPWRSSFGGVPLVGSILLFETLIVRASWQAAAELRRRRKQLHDCPAQKSSSNGASKSGAG